MPLPIPYPETDNYDHHREGYGVREINDKMRQETADEQKYQFPDMEFKGSGGYGMAVSLGDGKIGKYTYQPHEVENALRVKEMNLPCVAEIYDVQKIQEDQHGLWMIIMEEIEHLSEEDSHYISDLRFADQPRDTPLGIEYAELIECLQANRLNFTEAHGWNVGRNAKGRLVIFDLG